MYCALIVALKDSRKYPPESRDELQNLFSGAGAAFRCLRLLWRIFFQIPLHAGLGLGEWTAVIPARNSFYQDGSAYHRTRESVFHSKTLAEPYGPPSERLERDGDRLYSPFAHPYGRGHRDGGRGGAGPAGGEYGPAGLYRLY